MVSATCLDTGKEKVIKIPLHENFVFKSESTHKKRPRHSECVNALEREEIVYKYLVDSNSFQNAFNVKLESSKVFEKILVMDKLGMSLDKIYKRKPFKLKQVLDYGIQLLEIVRYFHLRNIVHNDIKPGNIVQDPKNENKIYLIDFGLWEPLGTPRTSGFAGTESYCGIGNHEKKPCSAQDDLISIGYTLIRLLGYKLPWNDVKGQDQIYKIKQSTRVQELCKNCPKEFEIYFDYVYNLDSHDIPLYNVLIDLFKKAKTS